MVDGRPCVLGVHNACPGVDLFGHTAHAAAFFPGDRGSAEIDARRSGVLQRPAEMQIKLLPQLVREWVEGSRSRLVKPESITFHRNRDGGNERCEINHSPL